MKHEDMNNEKIQKAFDNSIKIHLTLKDGSWRNGFVKDIKADFFTFKDDVNEKEPIFFLEVINVKPFTEGGK